MDWFFQNLNWIQTILIIIAAILTIGIVNLVLKIDYFSGFRHYTWEILKSKNLPKRRILTIWKKILHYVSSSDPNLWREAVLGTDRLFDEILKLSGHHGKTIEDRMDSVDSSQVYNIEEMKKIRTEMMEKLSDSSYVPELPKVKEFLRIYRQAFRQLGLME